MATPTLAPGARGALAARRPVPRAYNLPICVKPSVLAGSRLSRLASAILNPGHHIPASPLFKDASAFKAARGPAPAAAASAAAAAGEPSKEPINNNPYQLVKNQLKKFSSLAGKFMPMVGLFFLLAFVNTILDSLKDTLVITAVGGGAQVIPYLTVYAVLPSSLFFLVAYSYASQTFSRQTLFNGIVAVFMGFFVAFATFLYPNHQAIHLHAAADFLGKILPSGLDGLIGMIRNWTFTLFFCMSELWGDVCLGLLFWGLANDTTSLSDAPTLYPLFGIGANVAQALAGFVLKFFSGAASHGGSFAGEIQALMGVVMVFSVASLVVHHGISVAWNEQKKKARAERSALSRAALLAEASAATAASMTSVTDEVSTSASASASPASIERPAGSGNTADSPVASTSAAAAVDGGALSSTDQPAAKKEKKKKSKPSVQEIYRMLASSTAIRCLAIMSMAQGLCTSLMEFAWKSHIKMLYPTPAEFTSFLGDVSTWQGIVTGLLMVLSPTMFERMGWKGVAAFTPQILLYGGCAFFAVAMGFQFCFANSPAAAASAAGAAMLNLLVFGGALLYVFSKSAKFSLFKPAEEMVYISLDEEGRTKGKAAIDVVGSQFGKSTGSMLQQALLLISGGAITGILPIMAAVYFAMNEGWLRSVNTLSKVNNYGHESSVHITSSMDEDSDTEVPHVHPDSSRTSTNGNGNGSGSRSEVAGTDGGSPAVPVVPATA